MRIITCVVLSSLLCAGIAQAQTFGDLQIRLDAYTSSTNGGEKPLGVGYRTGPIVLGKSRIATFSVGESCEAFAVSGSAGELATNATAAWRIEVTPIRVVKDAVTFRLRWEMAEGGLTFRSQEVEPTPRRQDLELTLRPGESWPAVTVPRIPKYACDTPSSIRVSVDNYPPENEERRFVLADLWLVERLPDGSEALRSQSLSVRGLLNRPFRFYFNPVKDGATSLDVYGTLTARLAAEGMSVSVDTRSRWMTMATVAPGQRPPIARERSVTSEIQLRPDETVDIRLPTLSGDSGPFAKRTFSIRIRARQIQ